MIDYIKYEWKKLPGKPLIGVVAAVTLLFYLFSMTSPNIVYTSPQNMEYIITHKDYYEQLKTEQAGVVNEAFKEQLFENYKKFVDANLKPELNLDGTIMYEGIEYTVKDILYDWDHEYLILTEEAFNSTERDLFYDALASVEKAKDPKGMLIEYDPLHNYKGKELEDYLKCMDTYVKDQEIVSGFHFGWDVLVSINGKLPITLGLLLVVIFSGIFGNEKTYGMDAHLLTSKHGRKRLIRAKLVYVTLVSTVLWAVFQLMVIAYTAYKFGLEGANCTVLDAFFPCPYGVTYLQYYLLQLTVSFLGTIFFSLIICVLSSLFKRRIALGFGALYLLMTGLTINDKFQFGDETQIFHLVDKIKVLQPTQLMGAFNTFQMYVGYTIGPVVIRLPIMSYLVIIVGSVLCIVFIRWHEQRRQV
ncbi:MAG: hypothetical protein Q4F05_03370 [bacterium]|nr:hypothetical protein [bacterium]